eukprot:3306655-Amphidinium_carterae.1
MQGHSFDGHVTMKTMTIQSEQLTGNARNGWLRRMTNRALVFLNNLNGSHTMRVVFGFRAHCAAAGQECRLSVQSARQPQFNDSACKKPEGMTTECSLISDGKLNPCHGQAEKDSTAKPRLSDGLTSCTDDHPLQRL